jgi:hypothetical protein
MVQQVSFRLKETFRKKGVKRIKYGWQTVSPNSLSNQNHQYLTVPELSKMDVPFQQKVVNLSHNKRAMCHHFIT